MPWKKTDDESIETLSAILGSSKEFNLGVKTLYMIPASHNFFKLLSIAHLFLSSLSGDLDLDLDLERESSFRLELPLSLRSLLSLKGVGI